MTPEVIVALVMYFCPPNDVMEYYMDSSGRVTCEDYYTNKIVDDPDKYKIWIKYAKSE